MDISSIINQQMEPVKSVQNNLQKGYGKDTFLQILVAQMKYQNPLQPESNTEYISQYAIFSQIEQLSNIQNTLNLMRAENIIGKIVNIKETINGQINEVSGKIDKVVYKENTVYINVNGKNYLFNNVTEILDETFKDSIA